MYKTAIKTINCAFFIIAVLCFFSITQADILTLPLPTLNVHYTGSYSGPGRSAHADFQTEFLNIDELRIHLVGTYTPGTGHYNNGQPGIVYGELIASTPGWAILPRTMHSFDTQFDLTLPFFPFMNPQEDWSILLDGETDISFRLSMGTPCDIIDQVPEINVTYSELILYGTPVPEPATLLLICSGLVFLRKFA